MKTCDVSTRVQFRNVVFATDFSPAADAAIPYAAEIAKRFGAKVYALHVRPPIVNPMTPPETWVALEEAAEAQEREWRMTLRSAFPGVETAVLIEEGPLWSTLARVIEKERIDLIVTGTRGRSGVSKMLLGSVAEEILRQAPCPVLTVGPHSAPKPAGRCQISGDPFPDRFFGRISGGAALRDLAGARESGAPDSSERDPGTENGRPVGSEAPC